MRSELLASFVETADAGVSLDGVSSARPIVGRNRDYVSVGPRGAPILLLSCIGKQLLHRPPLGLQHLRVEYGIRYRVRTSSEVVDDVFTVISLRDDNQDLIEPFCLAGQFLIDSLPQKPTVAEVDRVIGDLIELLTVVLRPSGRAVSGLWAELWLISCAVQRDHAVEAWHFYPVDRFDFSFNTHFVEVKSTELNERAHEFAYDQIRNTKLPVQVVSLKLRRTQNGASISELLENIQLGLSPRLRVKLIRNVFGAVGDSIAEADEIRFDLDYAESNLRLINAESVPAVSIPPGSPISSVRFRVNLDDSSITKALKLVPSQTSLDRIW